MSNFSKIDAHYPESFSDAGISFSSITFLSVFKPLSTVDLLSKLFGFCFPSNKLKLSFWCIHFFPLALLLLFVILLSQNVR